MFCPIATITMIPLEVHSSDTRRMGEATPRTLRYGASPSRGNRQRQTSLRQVASPYARSEPIEERESVCVREHPLLPPWEGNAPNLAERLVRHNEGNILSFRNTQWDDCFRLARAYLLINRQWHLAAGSTRPLFGCAK